MLTLARSLDHPLAVTMMTIAFCVAAKADAQPVTGPTVAEPSAESTARISQLEKHIQQLETRIRDLEQQCPDANRKTSRTSSGRQASSSVATRMANELANECSPPYFVDPGGLRHFRRECLQSSPRESCDEPFVLDASGIKRVKVACLTQ